MGSIGAKRRVRIALACAGFAALAVAATPAAASAATALPDAGGATLGYGHPHFTLPEGAPKPTQPARIQSAYKVVKGTQTYTCAADGTWGTTSTPEAQLVQYDGRGRIHHYAGPRWTARDGSTILGKNDTTAAVPKPGTIAWLRLDVVAHENTKPGELDKVTWISRVNTTGGAVPTGTCTAGETKAVPYGADYVFWVPTK
ncbi:DUF3455 domain-containing protein [Cryptosporangium sp. NPDC048952]|uniref:DUF3455 domain-containing protein n=1 Tax=Cryptosporangium sp. NPDC048952 TaxID=3363961 RepID=UPI0037172316